MEIAIMLEGQIGLNWPRLERIARTVEDCGFAGLFRSDHFTNPSPPDYDSLELWISLTWLATNTQRIEFGQLVSPVSFRDPVMLARQAIQVDILSGGRLRLGVGAGWQEREHRMFGYDLLPKDQRFDRFAEGLEVVHRLIHSDEPVSFDGRFYRLEEAQLLPRPIQKGRPPIVVGGNGRSRTLPLAARFADEWNAVFIPPNRFEELNARMDELVQAAGRFPGDVRRTMMNGIVFGKDQPSLDRKLAGRNLEAMKTDGVVVGTPAQVKEQLEALAASGVQRIMLQWLDLDDIDGLEALAKAVL